MAYNIRYYFEFTAQTTGTPFRVELLQKDYTGLPKRIAIGASPVLTVEQESDGVRGSSLQMTLESTTNGELSTLYTTNNREWLVREYSQRGNMMKLIWQGYILPELYTEMWVDAPYDVQVTAVDGLGLLKYTDFLPTGQRRTLLAIMQDALSYTDLDLSFHILSTLHDTHFEQGLSTIYEHVTVNDSMFAGKTCYQVLQEIMTATSASITQHENRWTIRRWADIDKADAVVVTSSDRTLEHMAQSTLGKMHDAELYPLGSLQMDIVPALSGADFNFKYITANSLFYNGAMTEASDWTPYGDVSVPAVVTSDDGTQTKREMYVLNDNDAYIEQMVPVTVNSNTSFVLDIDLIPSFFGPEVDIYGSFNFHASVELLLTNVAKWPLTNDAIGIRGYWLKYNAQENTSSWEIIQYIADLDSGVISLVKGESPFRIALDTLITDKPITKDSMTRVSIPIPPLPSDYNGFPNIYLKIKNNSVGTILGIPVLGIKMNVGGVYMLPEALPEGYSQESIIAPKASTSAGEVDLALSDHITFDNADSLLFNTITGQGDYTYTFTNTTKNYTFWGAFIQQYIDRYCQKRMKLSGTINAPQGALPVLITEEHTGATMAVGAYSWTQLTEEMRVELEEVITTPAQYSGKTTIKNRGARAAGRPMTSLTSSNADNNTSVDVRDGAVRMRVNGDQRVVVSGDKLGDNDPAPTTATLLSLNSTLANTTSTSQVAINRSFPLMSVTVPAQGTNILLPPITFTASISGRGVFTLDLYLGWNNTGLKGSFITLTASKNVLTIPPLVLTTTQEVGANQALSVHVSGTFTPATTAASSLKLTSTAGRAAVVTPPTQVVEMARNGFRAAYSENRAFSLVYDEQTGDLKMTHRGTVDMPGVLMWGTLSANGSVINSGGYYFGSGAKTATGTYIINHSIGHQLYTVIAPGCTVTSRDNTSFEVSTGDVDAPFDFIVLGNNDK